MGSNPDQFGPALYNPSISIFPGNTTARDRAGLAHLFSDVSSSCIRLPYQCFKIWRRIIIRWIRSIFKNLEKFDENRKNSAETKLSRARNRKNFETWNLASLTELSVDFSKKLVIFEKPFLHLKKIWVNLNFNKLNDVVFEKYLHSEFILIFYIYFLFFKYFKSVNNKITDFEIRWEPNPSNFDKFQ
jgi:hypothetical protein